MLYRTKFAIAVIGVAIYGQGAEAASLCKPDLQGITLIEGAYNPPASIPPDTERLKPGLSWPAELIVQGWHHLRAKKRPLTLVCEYKGRPKEAFKLPDVTDSCELTYNGGLVFQCKQ